MASIINGKNGVAFLICGTLAVAGGLCTIWYLASEGYEPSLKFCGAELTLTKHHEAVLPAADDATEQTSESVTSEE